MPQYRDSGTGNCKIYVGDLGPSASIRDIEETFSYYGSIKNIWLSRNPPGFGFVEFGTPHEAEDAVRGLDGRTICGRRARVEMANGVYARSGTRRGRPFHPDDCCFQCGCKGHYARDCYRFRDTDTEYPYKNERSHRQRSNSRSRSRSRDSYSRPQSAPSRSKDRSSSHKYKQRDRPHGRHRRSNST